MSKKAIDLIAKTERPLICRGQGAFQRKSGSAQGIAERNDIAVAAQTHEGHFPDEHRLSIEPVSRRAHECDLVLFVGQYCSAESRRVRVNPDIKANSRASRAGRSYGSQLRAAAAISVIESVDSFLDALNDFSALSATSLLDRSELPQIKRAMPQFFRHGMHAMALISGLERYCRELRHAILADKQHQVGTHERVGEQVLILSRARRGVDPSWVLWRRRDIVLFSNLLEHVPGLRWKRLAGDNRGRSAFGDQVDGFF